MSQNKSIRFFTYLGLECVVLVIVNLQLQLKNQSSVRIWKESGALITKNVEKGDIVLIMGNTNKKVHTKILTKIERCIALSMID